jgi:hypothetical protein
MATIFGMRCRCNAPVGDGKCGQPIAEVVCDPIEGPPIGMFRNLLPGPTLTHLPCGHDWWRGQGWEPKLERVPWAKATD